MVSLHRRVREEAPSHVLIEEFLHTLFRRCNKTASERVLLEYPYTRGSENLPKKSAKKLVRGSLLSKDHRDRTKKVEFV